MCTNKQVLGHTLGDEKCPTPDVISEGFTTLTWGAKAPLQQFNQMINTLQQCCSIQPLVGATLPTQTQETRKFSSSHTIDLLMLCILAISDFSHASSEDDCMFTGNNLDGPDNEELKLNEELEGSLDETQPILSLQTPEDVDLDLDADLQVHADTLDEGDETDVSEGDRMDSLN